MESINNQIYKYAKYLDKYTKTSNKKGSVYLQKLDKYLHKVQHGGDVVSELVTRIQSIVERVIETDKNTMDELLKKNKESIDFALDRRIIQQSEAPVSSTLETYNFIKKKLAECIAITSPVTKKRLNEMTEDDFKNELLQFPFLKDKLIKIEQTRNLKEEIINCNNEELKEVLTDLNIGLTEEEKITEEEILTVFYYLSAMKIKQGFYSNKKYNVGFELDPKLLQEAFQTLEEISQSQASSAQQPSSASSPQPAPSSVQLSSVPSSVASSAAPQPAPSSAPSSALQPVPSSVAPSSSLESENLTTDKFEVVGYVIEPSTNRVKGKVDDAKYIFPTEQVTRKSMTVNILQSQYQTQLLQNLNLIDRVDIINSFKVTNAGVRIVLTQIVNIMELVNIVNDTPHIIEIPNQSVPSTNVRLFIKPMTYTPLKEGSLPQNQIEINKLAAIIAKEIVNKVKEVSTQESSGVARLQS